MRWLAPLVVTGCFGPVVPTGAPCTTQMECPSPLVCDHGRCERELSGDIDAPMEDIDAATDASIPIDGDPGCVCTTSMAISCNGGADTPCSLGCLTLPDGARCAELAPSNNVVVDLAGTGALSISSGTAIFDTSTGQITGTVTRAAGVGVIGGIGYEQRTFGAAQLGVFTVMNLDVTVGATIELAGTRSAVFIVGTTATIAGTIDATGGGCPSDRQCPGAGGGAGGTLMPAVGCGAGAVGQRDPNVATGADGGGGGAGGGAAGADGGDAGTFLGGSGGMSCLAADNEPLIGGSGGGAGGAGASTSNPPKGGGGGGAFQLTALTRITVTGTIASGGAGGQGGPGAGLNAAAGAGGGGGGALLLEAPVVELMTGSTLAANGGAGGGGGNFGTNGQGGTPGQASATPSIGGAPSGTSGRGGNGGAGTMAAAAGTSVANNLNAGGGGGAVGRIYLRAMQNTNAGVTSPAIGTGPLRTR